MPTYEYECLKCKQTFEVEQPMADPPLDFHYNNDGKCGPVKRLIAGSTGFTLKGNGWYKDGY